MSIWTPSEWHWLRQCPNCAAPRIQRGHLLCQACERVLQRYERSEFFYRPEGAGLNSPEGADSTQPFVVGHCLWNWIPSQSDLLSQHLLQLKGGSPADVWRHWARELWLKARGIGEKPLYVPAPSLRPHRKDHAFRLAFELAQIEGGHVWPDLCLVPNARDLSQKKSSRVARFGRRIEVKPGADLERISQATRVVVVDDVVTTGATVMACGMALGLAPIEVWSLAQRSQAAPEGPSASLLAGRPSLRRT